MAVGYNIRVKNLADLTVIIVIPLRITIGGGGGGGGGGVGTNILTNINPHKPICL